MNVKPIEDYFASKIHKPFYMVVGDKEYREVIDNLKSRAISFLRISECCKNIDKLPDLDAMREKLETADVSFSYNNIVMLGLGEYLALCGNEKTNDVLTELKDYNLGNAQVVLLLRCVEPQVRLLVKNDKRLIESGRVAFSDELATSLRFKFSDPGLGIYKINGVKNLLKVLEDGAGNEVSANTVMEFRDSLLPIQRVRDSYEAIARNINMDEVPKEYGTEDMWEKLLIDLRNMNFQTNKLFKEYGFTDFQDADFYGLLYGEEYNSWLFYIYLVMNAKTYEGKYLGYVLKNSTGLSDFKRGILCAIIAVSHTNAEYQEFYKERKRLLSHYPEAEIAPFVNDNRVNVGESVYKLTDNTLVEKQEVIIWIANNGLPENLRGLYPDLAAYTNRYSFNGNGLDSGFAARITTYFEKYKELKLINSLTDDFLKEVDKLALERIYNRLPKRDELVKEKNDGSTQLFWFDALGVEYLGFIVELARRRGLKISVEIGRAELPTITCENNAFFKNWPEDLRHPKEEELDEIKHKDKGGYYYSSKNPYPIHLARELEIIEKAVSDVATTLGLRKYERVVIASDHGASRLAVLRNKEEKYETDTKGKHSGRCCKFFSGCDLPFAINEEDRGYIVLADYGRFKGSRKANVEVHGGASLEEVIVPIITFSLNDSSFVVTVVDGEKIKADYKKGISVTLYVNKTIRDALTIGYENKRYQSERIDDNHFKVDILDIKRAGTYSADVYLGNNLAGHIEIEAAGKSATMNDDFDDLF